MYCCFKLILVLAPIQIATNSSISARRILCIVVSIQLGDMNSNSDKTAHEAEPKESEIGISIRGLSKVFKVVCSL